ncbi:hypothetical protein V502_03150, partial [Pseudogymnoascus sp. VKM F-4520 (FW-2644)]
MALPLPAGLTPAETAFLCENEPITVIPRQRMQSIELLSGPGKEQLLTPPPGPNTTTKPASAHDTPAVASTITPPPEPRDASPPPLAHSRGAGDDISSRARLRGVQRHAPLPLGGDRAGA